MEQLKKFAVTIAGFAILAVGLALMFLPGPGILLIVAGLAVLATEYAWARRLLVKAKEQAQTVQEAAVSSPLRTAGSIVFAVGIVILGVAMFFGDFIAWPVWRATLDSVWSPVTGSVLVITGVILVATTVITVRTAKGSPTTFTNSEGQRFVEGETSS